MAAYGHFEFLHDIYITQNNAKKLYYGYKTKCRESHKVKDNLTNFTEIKQKMADCLPFLVSLTNYSRASIRARLKQISCYYKLFSWN